jgi:hypothetical protein
MTNTVIYGNFGGTTTDSWGAGLAVEAASVDLVHPTVHYNTGGVGNAVFATSSSTIVMTNAIVADHTTVAFTVSMDSNAYLNGVLWYDNGANAGGQGSVYVTNELTGTPDFGADGYHLESASQAIDAGVVAGVTMDIDGQIRHLPDLGADEWRGDLTIDPDTGGVITYTNGQGLTLTIQVAPGAVTETAMLLFAPIPSSTLPFSPGLQFSEVAFNLDALCGSSHSIYLPIVMRSHSRSAVRAATGSDSDSIQRCGASSRSSPFDPSSCSPSFQVPVTITIHYSNQDIAGLDENTLALYYWDSQQWVDASGTCSPPHIQLITATNTLEVAICHLSQFSMGGR